MGGLERRSVIGGLIAAMMPVAGRAARTMPDPQPFLTALAGLEARAGGRLGVAFVPAVGGAVIGRRLHERFPMCSTFKLLAVSAVLAKIDAGQDRLDRVIRFRHADLVSYSPITQAAADGPGLTLDRICAAAITMSDNSAGNLLLDAIGGPSGLTRFCRRIGDPVTRLDRRETALNSAIAGDPRDTTSPTAMAVDLGHLAMGSSLSGMGRTKLLSWLVDCRTGDRRLRAGLPGDWRIGQKTGTGDNGTSSDVAILWPPAGQPIIVAAYLTGSRLDAVGRDAVLADVGRAIATAMPSNPSR